MQAISALHSPRLRRTTKYKTQPHSSGFDFTCRKTCLCIGSYALLDWPHRGYTTGRYAAIGISIYVCTRVDITGPVRAIVYVLAYANFVKNNFWDGRVGGLYIPIG